VCVAPPPQGSVGFSIKFYDMCLAVINAHLAADLKGRNRVERRNQVRRWSLSAGRHLYYYYLLLTTVLVYLAITSTLFYYPGLIVMAIR